VKFDDAWLIEEGNPGVVGVDDTDETLELGLRGWNNSE